MNADVILDELCSSHCQDQCVDPCFCDERPVPDPPYVTRSRYNPANPPTFTENDIILNEGDIVIIRSQTPRHSSRQVCSEAAKHQLPRDKKDLDIIGAIAIAGGPLGVWAQVSVGLVVGTMGRRSLQWSDELLSFRSDYRPGIALRKFHLYANRSEQSSAGSIATRPDQKPNDVVILRYTLTEEIGNAFLNMLQFNYLFGSGLRR